MGINKCGRCSRLCELNKKHCEYHLKYNKTKAKIKREKRKQASLCLACGRKYEICKCRNRAKLLKKERLKNKICIDCGKNSTIYNIVRCQKCKDKHNKRKDRFCKICLKQKVFNKKQICDLCKNNKYNKTLKPFCLFVRGIKKQKINNDITDTTCNRCNKNKVRYGYKRCGECNKYANEHYHTKNKLRYCEKRYINKKISIEHYGSKCAICKENNLVFLTIDHLFGSGRKHREKIGKNNSEFYLWLIKNNFPGGFQVLCYNCNIKKYRKELSLKSKSTNKTAIQKRNELIKLKNIIFDQYGKYCQCCLIKDIDVLCIDHINDGGNNHRKLIGKSGIEYYKWIIKSKYPSFLRIMCYSCNNARRINKGICPHQQKSTGEVCIIDVGVPTQKGE